MAVFFVGIDDIIALVLELLADFLDALANFLAVALHAFEPILTEIFKLLA